MRLNIAVDIDEFADANHLVLDDLKGARLHNETIKITTDTNVYNATLVAVIHREDY